MASCFPLRMVLFSGFILLVFLSHHLSNVSTTCSTSGKKRRGKLEKRKIWSHLTHSSMGLDSPALAPVTLFTMNFPGLGMSRWAVLPSWSWQSVLELCSSLGNDHGTSGVCEDEHWSKHASQWHFEHCSMLK